MPQIHIVGAGLSGLSCAVNLVESGYKVAIYDLAGHAGGRCRSFYDDILECIIDNGNHLLLSGNKAVAEFLLKTGAKETLTGPERALYPFVDLKENLNWTVEISDGKWPNWIFHANHRPPGVSLWEMIQFLKLFTTNEATPLGEIFNTESMFFRRFLEPLALGILNTPATIGSAKLLATVMRETFACGGTACRPLMAISSLSETFVNPALKLLASHGITFRKNSRLREISIHENTITRLQFTDFDRQISDGDAVVLALPPLVSKALLPQIDVPTNSNPIVNAHFRLDKKITSLQKPGLLGLIGGTGHWIFFRSDVISVTVSAANKLANKKADEIAHLIWSVIRRAIPEVKCQLPIRHRIIKERRATIPQTPVSIRGRPSTDCGFKNLYLAGDWTETGLPATIEGAIRSGVLACQAIIKIN